MNNDVSDYAWMSYWKYYIFIHIVVSMITMVWFSIGGFKDLKAMMLRLKTAERDHQDDGWVARKD